MSVSPPTQKQIAQRLEISHQVVSSALGGSGRVGEATRQLVLQEAQRMGYKPNKAAQALVTKRFYQVALWLHSLSEPFAVDVQECVRKAVNQSGYDLVIRSGNDRHPLNSLLDGMLALSSPSLSEAASLEWAQGVPLVMMGVLPHTGLQKCDGVGIGVRAAAEEAVRHLQEKGCRRIAYLAVSTLMNEEEPRCAAYRSVMRESGRGIEEIAAPHILPIRTDVRQTLLRHIEKHGAPDGLLCGNDDTALGAMLALRDLGLRVPQDVKVIGCDGTRSAADADPTLSTLAFPLEEMCQSAWRLLQRRLNEPELPLQHLQFQSQLILRESSR